MIMYLVDVCHCDNLHDKILQIQFLKVPKDRTVFETIIRTAGQHCWPANRR